MIKIIALFSIFILTIGFMFNGINTTVKAQDNLPRPRFERVYDEETHGVVDIMTIYHDKETGNEIMCAYVSNATNSSISLSCLQTGRNWK